MTPTTTKLIEENCIEFEHWVNELRSEVKEFCPMCGIKPKKFLESYRSSLLAVAEKVHKEAVEKVRERMPRQKESWAYGGGGGIDTEHWCRRGFCLSIPGIKQIVSYGIKNDSWWTKYFLKYQIILPEKYKTEGYNQSLSDTLSSLTKLSEEIEKIK